MAGLACDLEPINIATCGNNDMEETLLCSAIQTLASMDMKNPAATS